MSSHSSFRAKWMFVHVVDLYTSHNRCIFTCVNLGRFRSPEPSSTKHQTHMVRAVYSRLRWAMSIDACFATIFTSPGRPRRSDAFNAITQRIMSMKLNEHSMYCCWRQRMFHRARMFSIPKTSTFSVFRIMNLDAPLRSKRARKACTQRRSWCFFANQLECANCQVSAMRKKWIK